MIKIKQWCYVLGAILLLLFFSNSVYATTGNFCTSSPCSCGTNCRGVTSDGIRNTAPAEPGWNTIDSCSDGSEVVWEWVHDIFITSLNRSIFVKGDTVQIIVSYNCDNDAYDMMNIVYCNSTEDCSSNPNLWKVIYGATCNTASWVNKSINITLDNLAGNHSIRGAIAYTAASNQTCGYNGHEIYSDTDDVTFLVQAESPDVTNPLVDIISPTPANNSNQTSRTFLINVSHVESHPDTITLNWNGANETYYYIGNYTNITKYGLSAGQYSYYLIVNDTYGNQNITTKRTVNILPNITITFVNPSNGSLFNATLIDLNLTIISNDANSTINLVSYNLNYLGNTTLSNVLNISLDSSDSGLNESNENYLNISQSFTPQETMDISNISIRLRMAGTGSQNATVQIMIGNSTPLNSVIGIGNFSNSSIDTAGFTWVNITLNATVRIQANTKYWIFLNGSSSASNHYEWETNDNGIYPFGESSINSSRDFLFRIYDSYRYRDRISINSLNNITVYAANSLGHLEVSSISFSLDNIAPAYSNITYSSSIEVGNNQTIKVTVTDQGSYVSSVSVEYDSANHTMNYEGSNLYNYTFSPSRAGNISFRIYLNDSLNNQNYTSAINFTVNDTFSPIIESVSYTPSNADVIDPNILLSITVNITDFGGVANATLQYKNSTESSWTNQSMINSSLNIFIENITPNSEGNWSFKILTKDWSNNANSSNAINVSVYYDYSWILSPATTDAIGGVIETNITLFNLTINNTGDYALEFQLSSYGTTPLIWFNESSSFSLSAKQIKVLEVNATCPLTASEYAIKVLVNSTNDTASPRFRFSNTTLSTYLSGPHLYALITVYDSTVTIGDHLSNMTATIYNLGNATATNVNISWTIPSGWTGRHLSESIGNLSVGGLTTHSVSVDIGSTASTGTQSISVNVNCSEGASDSDTKTTTVSNPPSTPSGGTSGSTGGGGGGGGGTTIIISDTLLLTISSDNEVISGKNVTIKAKITSLEKTNSLGNITAQLIGYKKDYFKISPNKIVRLEYNESTYFTILIEAPIYSQYQKYTLNFSVDAQSGNSTITRSKTFLLTINEFDRNESLSKLKDAKKSISSLQERGYSTFYLSSIIDKADRAFNDGRFKEAYQLSEQVIEDKEKAVLAADLINESRKRIENAIISGADVSQTIKILGLAIDSFGMGDYNEALKMANQALLVSEIEKSEPVDMMYLFNLAIKYWQYSIAGLFMVFVLLAVITKSSLIILSKRRIVLFKRKKEKILELMKQAQEAYFEKRIIGEALYNKTINKYREDMAAIEIETLKTRTKIISQIKNKGNLKALKEESCRIEETLKELQTSYYDRKEIPYSAYEKISEGYNERIIDLKKQIKMIENKKKS
ncbi:MAG: NEW3 domain-containing protein [archaeon]